MKKIGFITLTTISLLLIIWAGGCSTGTSSTVIPAQIQASPEINNQAPDFSVNSLDGKTMALSNFRAKNVLLNFWSILCDRCEMENNIFEVVHEEYPDIQIMMVDSKEDSGTIRRFVRDTYFTLPVYIDKDGITASIYGVDFIPETFLIDSNGIIKYIQHEAFANQTQLENALKSLQKL
jgi:peroxiredoxin